MNSTYLSIKDLITCPCSTWVMHSEGQWYKGQWYEGQWYEGQW